MFKMSNKTYDVLKYIAQIVLPSIAVFYAGLSKIWPVVPYPVEISGTIMLVDALLGKLLNISTEHYNEENKIEPPEEE